MRTRIVSSNYIIFNGYRYDSGLGNDKILFEDFNNGIQKLLSEKKDIDKFILEVTFDLLSFCHKVLKYN